MVGLGEGNSSPEQRLAACHICSMSHVICRALVTRSTKNAPIGLTIRDCPPRGSTVATAHLRTARRDADTRSFTAQYTHNGVLFKVGQKYRTFTRPPPLRSCVHS
jgi:hypothetical protein